jgi:tRNA-dihydrouridine synthase
MLAPMAELSHRALRELVESFVKRAGSAEGEAPSAESAVTGPEYFTEMISAPGLLAGGPLEKWYLDPGPRPERLVYQLLGADIDQLAAAAALLDKTGCRGIDLNMGCAAPLITRTGAGVRWMEDAGRAARLVEAVRRTTGKRLSVKLRLGAGKDFPAAADSQKAAPFSRRSGDEARSGELFSALEDFCRRLVNAGAELVTLHPRMAGEKFRRRARWEYVDRLRQALPVPVAGNGDIASAEEALAKAEAGPVMIGRLAARKPWIFAQALYGAAASPETGCYRGMRFLEETALCFLDLLSRCQPPVFHLSRARRFFHYYCDNFTWAEYLRNKIRREDSLAGIAGVLGAYCRENES